MTAVEVFPKQDKDEIKFEIMSQSKDVIRA